MRHDDVLTSLRSSAAVKLLSSQNAPLVLSFLYDQFKKQQQLTVPHTRMIERLDAFLDSLRQSYPDSYSGTATYYLRLWCDDDHRFLRRYYTPKLDEPVYELTPDTERALGWVEELQKSEFVGTESRFLRIFDLLEEIAIFSSEDVELRLAQLEAEKARLEDQIAVIKSSGQIEQYSQTQIKERFFEANDVARRLLADFREVEENFRSIVREVQAQQLAADARKGRIVEHVLAADAALKDSDQGRSFYAFWEFLVSAERQEILQELLNAVYRLPDLQLAYQSGGQRLRRLKRNLIDAGAKIVESNRRLAEQLRKLLDEQNIAEARRVLELATEIKRLAAEQRPPPGRAFFLLERDPAVDMPHERPLWSPPEQRGFAEDKPEVAELDLSMVDLTVLFGQFHIDEGQLRRRVAVLLEERPAVTLAELARVYPLRLGLAELVAYVALAARGETHMIEPGVVEPVPLGDTGRIVRLPRVVFQRELVEVAA